MNIHILQEAKDLASRQAVEREAVRKRLDAERDRILTDLAKVDAAIGAFAGPSLVVAVNTERSPAQPKHRGIRKTSGDRRSVVKDNDTPKAQTHQSSIKPAIASLIRTTLDAHPEGARVHTIVDGVSVERKTSATVVRSILRRMRLEGTVIREGEDIHVNPSGGGYIYKNATAASKAAIAEARIDDTVRAAVLRFVNNHPEGVRYRRIFDAVKAERGGVSETAVQTQLRELHDDGEIVREGKSRQEDQRGGGFIYKPKTQTVIDQAVVA